ncbi:MAG: DNA translocase FtsK [Chloroflexota bacterium]|nr:DNA translocase FtsK [Chloroflexota bacterium]
MSINLRSYLETQSDRTEALLAAHSAPARITGGTVGPRLIRLFLNPAPHTRFATIQGLTDDLALALRVPSLRIGRGDEGVILEMPNPHPRPVSLSQLLPEVAPLPHLTAMLGLTDAGVPLLARLSSPDVAHVLVSGATGSGKSALLRTMAVSLVLSQSAADLRLLCLDPQGRTFGSLVDAPHLLRPPVVETHEALEALRSLLREMEIRDRRNEDAPAIVLLVDELVDLVSQSESAVLQALTQLVQRGHETGIHVVAATQRPSSAILSGLLRANFPLRLVGKVVSAEDARVAAGRAKTDAHLLSGRGDFLAVGGSATPIRFQVAFIKERDARKKIAQL